MSIAKAPGNKREFTGLLGWIVRGFSFAFGAFFILSCSFGPLPYMEQSAIYVFFGLTIVLINIMAIKRRKPETGIPWWDVILIGIVIAIVVNEFINWNHYLVDIWYPSPYEYFLGIALMLIIFEGTRRSMGWVMPALTLAALAYIYIAPYLPGIWVLGHMPFGRLVTAQFFQDQGVWGTITSLGSNIIGIYIVFGSILLITGGGRTFTEIALALAGRIRGGPALVSVVASAMFGMISGSAVANVASTGNFTIPLMKRLGYRPETAAGIEATASCGGAFTPPVMGAAAFIMAELLGVPYTEIVIAAIFPAFLFYSTIFFSVLLEARKRGVGRVPEEEIPSLRGVLTWSKLGPLIIPIAILLWLIVKGDAAYRAGSWAIAASLFLHLFATSTDFSWTAIKRRLMTVWNAVEAGGRSLGGLTCLIVCASLLVGLINYSGLGVKISAVVMALAREQLLVALIVGAITCIVLGMALPATASYIISVSVVGIGFVKLGLDPLPVHMFCFFYAGLATITPPTGAPVFVAAGIANASWIKTFNEAMRLGIVAFIIPITFVYNPVYLMIGEPSAILIGVALAIVGTFFLACGGFGYLRSAINIPSRLIFFAAGFLLLIPFTEARIMGALGVVGGMLVMIAPQLIKRFLPQQGS